MGTFNYHYYLRTVIFLDVVTSAACRPRQFNYLRCLREGLRSWIDHQQQKLTRHTAAV
nr:MAG TPA_asm: hypothetical protein [Caudoviricetes sp.]